MIQGYKKTCSKNQLQLQIMKMAKRREKKRSKIKEQKSIKEKM